MRKVDQTAVGSDIYARIRELPMNDADRQAAINALHQSEVIAEVMLWVKHKVAQVGAFFLKPSLSTKR